MKFIAPRSGATDYAAFFECAAADRLALLRFMEYVTREQVYERILALDKFKPSELWKGWVAGTFVGFSSEQVMYKSGHRFLPAALLKYDAAYARFSLRGVVSRLASVLLQARAAAREQYDAPEHQLRAFRRFYPDAAVPPVHKALLETHPLPYLRALEVLNVGRYQPRSRVLEVGAGACANLALLRMQFGVKAVIVDLPETMYAGYLLLRTLFPAATIALPNDVAAADGSTDLPDYDFVFLLPTQIDRIPAGAFDHAFNMSSFQEMELGVVNNYLAVMRRALMPGGTVVLCNLEVSRQIDGNAVAKYDLSGFDAVTYHDAPYQNWGLRNIPGLRQQVVVAKSAAAGVAAESSKRAAVRISGT